MCGSTSRRVLCSLLSGHLPPGADDHVQGCEGHVLPSAAPGVTHGGAAASPPGCSASFPTQWGAVGQEAQKALWAAPSQPSAHSEGPASSGSVPPALHGGSPHLAPFHPPSSIFIYSSSGKIAQLSISRRAVEYLVSQEATRAQVLHESAHSSQEAHLDTQPAACWRSLPLAPPQNFCVFSRFYLFA